MKISGRLVTKLFSVELNSINSAYSYSYVNAYFYAIKFA